MVMFTELRKSTRAIMCMDCGKCSSACPLCGPGGVTPRRIVQGALRDFEGDTRGTRACLTCGACEERCPEGVKFIDFVRGLRELRPASRAACPHAETFQSLARSTIGPEPPRRDLSWIGPDLEVAETGKVALFVGCLPVFERYFEGNLPVQPLDIARSAIRIMNAAGTAPVVMTEERCCGHDLLWNGDETSFRALAEANAAAFAERGIEHVVTACSECARTLGLDYPEALPGLRLKVEHVSEYLARELEEGRIAFEGGEPQRITYQDPCRLARHHDVVEAPRSVFAALPATELREMKHAGRDATCCGTSGFIHCDAESRRLQSARLEEARETGAGFLVTACPKCLIHFSCAQAEDRRRGIEPAVRVKDFTVLAAERLVGDITPSKAASALAAGAVSGDSP